MFVTIERKPTAGLILFTALFTLGSVMPAYAAEGSSTNTVSTALSQPSSLQSAGIPGTDQGHDAGLRPGGNPADPSSLPFAQGNYGQSSGSMQANSLSLAAAAIPARTTYPQTLGTDLVLGKPYQVNIQYPDSFFALTESHFPTTNQLTDGKYGQLTYADHSWQAFYRQYGRTVTVALGQKDNIQALSLDFLEYTAAGITFPESVTYQVSQDGKNWSTLGTVKDAIGTWSTAPVTQAYQLTGLNINAEYVRAKFSVAVFAFADEFGVFGSTTPNPTGQTPIGEPTPPTQPLGYLPANAPQSGGIHNLLLAYADGNGVSGTWTESDFLPMLQEQPGATGPGVPKGPDGRSSSSTDQGGLNHKKLFDSVLFLPYGSFANATGLSGFVQNLFTPSIQLAALNQAAGAKGGRPTKVVIAIPGLDNNPTNFGSLTPGGASLDLNPAVVGQTVAYQNKLQVIQWYINQVMTAWKQANFSHLQLAGFYWTPESLNITLEYKHALVEQTAQMVHATGTRFYWIPFYGAYGITEWKQLGFDAVMVQPNVAFNFSIDPASRFASVAQLAQNLGLGVEMELYWGSLSTTNLRLAQLSQDRWDDYLTGGHLFGWEHGTMLSYYDSSKDFVTVADSPSLYYHQVYGNLGTFINRSWERSSFVNPVATTIKGLKYTLSSVTGQSSLTAITDSVSQPIVRDNYGQFMANIGTYTVTGPTGYQGVTVNASPYSTNNPGAGDLTISPTATTGQYTIAYSQDNVTDSVAVNVGSLTLSESVSAANGEPAGGATDARTASVTASVYDTVTATVYSAWGLPVVGLPVTFSVDGGTLSAPTAITSTSGTASVVVTSHHAHRVSLTASANGLTADVRLTFTSPRRK